MNTLERPSLTGVHLLHDPVWNKGTSFTERERDVYRLRGLLPPRVNSQEQQVERVLENLRRKESDLERYIFMMALQDRNETLFYRLILDHLEELAPIIYTPTVGRACQEYGHIFRRPRGIFISLEDAGRVASLICNWPYKDIRVIVVTDGERILGLGDLGADGMGIPVGKLSLYTACGGINPTLCLPVTIDVGTNNEGLRKDPLYIGRGHPRVRGAAYDALIKEFVEAVQGLFPRALIQFEDFGNTNAFRLLAEYRDKVCAFNDDIQGTAAVVLAGLHSATNFTQKSLVDQRYLFFGAGEAGTGIADLLVEEMKTTGCSEKAARDSCWFVDSKGLVVRGRQDLAEHKIRYAHHHPFLSDPVAIVKSLRPAAIIGVSGQPGVFSEPVLRLVGKINERPIIFALSNPTSRSECTAEAAYRCTSGRAIFACGSPFDPVVVDGKKLFPGQGNNVYIFPGLGLGTVVAESRRVTDKMLLAAARTLAGEVNMSDLAEGRIYPRLARIRQVSVKIAIAVAKVAYNQGLTAQREPVDLEAHIRDHMYVPTYTDYA